MQICYLLKEIKLINLLYIIYITLFGNFIICDRHKFVNNSIHSLYISSNFIAFLSPNEI